MVLGTVLAAAALAAVAYADDISNNLDATVDAVAEVMPLNEGGVNGTTMLYVVPRNGDGKNGCNLTAGTSLVLSLSSNNTSAATVIPSSITFTSCGDTPVVTVTPHNVGSATISASQTSNNTGASFNFAPVTFTVDVAPPPNTAPSVSVSGVTGGASYDKGFVPAAACDVTDAEDGLSSFAATLSAITGPYAADGIGEQTASCSYTDGGGLTASAAETYNIVDSSAPIVDYALNPASSDGENAWWVTDVALTWSVTESESPTSLSKTGCDDQAVTADQAATTYSCSALSAGGGTGPVDVTIKRDATDPTIDGAVTPLAPSGSNGWYKTAPTVTFSCADVTSGVVSCAVDGVSPATDHVTLGESVSAQSVGGTARDDAGNTNTASVTGLMVDLSDPTVASWSGGIDDGDSFYFGSVPAVPTCIAADDVSGPDDCVVSGYSTAVSLHTLIAAAKDKAGRTGTDTRSYTVLPWTLSGFYQPVDMTPLFSPTAWNTVKGGSTVPLKFEAFVGSTELTDTSNVIRPLRATQTSCAGGTTDQIELAASGATSLRYDATAGQFIYNWQTPRMAGYCYVVTVTTLDGSSLTAYFKLK